MNRNTRSLHRRIARTVVYTLVLSPIAATHAADSAVAALEEVIVTATKREEPLREIPASIVALTSEQLEARGVQGLEDIARLVPGVNLTKPGDSALRVTIRGIAAEAGTNPTAGTLFENTSFSDAYLQRVTLDPHPFDLASVEVLKGPQGTLFGAGALNGMIRYMPQLPQFGVWTSRYFAQYSELSEGSSEVGYGAVLNGPLGSNEQAAFRIMAFNRDGGGYIDNLRTGGDDANEREQTGARGILQWRPNESWDVRLMYAWQQTQDDDSTTTDNADGRLSVSNRPRTSPSYSKYDLTSLHVEYGFDAATLVSETAYVEKSSNSTFDNSSRLLPGGALPILMQRDTSRTQTWSQELRLVSTSDPDDRWRWVVGAFASRQDVDYSLSYLLGDPTLPDAAVAGLLNLAGGLGDVWLAVGRPNYVNALTDVRIEERAVFADVTRKLGEQWELSLGGRFYQTESGGTAQQNGLLLYALGFNGSHLLDDSLSDDGFNPRLSLLWHASDDVLAYGTVSRGFRVGGVQPFLTTPLNPVRAPDTFKSDSIWNYEAGIRTQWLDRTLFVDLTAFFEKWSDPQSFQVDITGLTTYIDNVGGVESKGAELSLQYALPVRGLTFTAATAYTDATTTESYTTSAGIVVPSGTRWPLSPEWQTTAALTQEVELGSWTLSGSVAYTNLDEAIYGLAQPGRIFGYEQWDARISLSSATMKSFPRVTLEVTNVSDERGITNSFSGTTYTDVTYLRPRAVTLRLNGEF